MKKLLPPKLTFFTPAEIKPTGYMLERLRAQANGLSGNLHKFWRDIKDSKWIGGDADGWERVPYWLDGFIPMAYLLDDEELKATAKFYINHILALQDEDGWICPCEKNERGRYDMWAYFLILKVLTVYHSATGDERIYPAVYSALKKLDEHIDSFTLFDWAQTRWYEALIPIYWLLGRTDEEWIYGLVNKIRNQGFDFYSFFRNWNYEKKTPRGKWSQMSHVVNNAMMLKGDALYSLYNHDARFADHAEYMYRKLRKYHGTAAGTFTGDECLAGTDPRQGTELCAVAELMYSFENLLSVTGDPKWADRLDRATFNALFATFSPDMWSHQYDQQVNQVYCTEMKNPIYTTNPGDSNLFGLEPNFGCCTSNLSQPLPKFILTSFMKGATEDGREKIAVINLSPARLDTVINGSPVSVAVDGEYPFGDLVRITVKTQAPVVISVRVPAWAKATLVRGGERTRVLPGFVDLEVTGDEELRLECAPETALRRAGGLAFFTRGALTYSLKIKEKWTRVHGDVPGREYPHCDYEVLPASEWRYAIADEKPRFVQGKIDGNPFDPEHAPTKLIVKCVRYPWEVDDGCVTPKPRAKAAKEIEEVEFIPYGCTDLRLTALPLVKVKTI